MDAAEGNVAKVTGDDRNQDRRREGTFDFPPHLAAPVRLVQFWLNVPVDDNVAMSLVAAYQARQCGEEAQFAEQWKAVHPATANSEQWRADLDRAVADWQSERETQTPAAIPASWAKPLARVAKLHQAAAADLNDVALPLVMALTITMPGGAKATIPELVERFRLVELRPHIRDSIRWDATVRAIASTN